MASESPSRLGILGGTFDPPHLGHLILAECAFDALHLDAVLFAPAAEPPHKDGDTVMLVEHRLAMVELAIAENAHFALSRVDLDRPGPHYTVDMLKILHREYPDAELYFLMGGDSLNDLLTWRDPAGIIAQAHLGVARRPDSPLDLTDLAAHLPGLIKRVATIAAPMVGISATHLRKCVQSGASIRYQVPLEVERYIVEHRLYLA
jgi:nicotinate-nucleotide adenylyltransferase